MTYAKCLSLRERSTLINDLCTEASNRLRKAQIHYKLKQVDRFHFVSRSAEPSQQPNDSLPVSTPKYNKLFWSELFSTFWTRLDSKDPAPIRDQLSHIKVLPKYNFPSPLFKFHWFVFHGCVSFTVWYSLWSKENFWTVKSTLTIF